MGSIFEVAPTILDWLGSGAPGYMEGEPLRRWMTDSWNESNSESRCRDHRSGFRKATPPTTPGEDASASFLDSMREIGYVDSED